MSRINHPQLPLGFEPGELFTFDSFIAGPNTVATGLAQQLIRGEGESQLFFWGDSGLGKSHLLQASCNLAAKRQQSVCYLTAAQINGQAVEMFAGLETLDLLCLDELERWLVEPQWQLALFDLINRVRENGSRLIMAATQPPDVSFAQLPDLRSRLSWGPVFQLLPLSDEDKYQALSYRARQNGLELPRQVADYLMQRYPRDMFGLFERLALLDKASMAMQRKLTIPLVKSVFGSENMA
ncbi:MAG TPA: DnaA regulatory inactivator Hda [Gammaproteobacteria bacterium]|nr:DnaA regulatory inactivator Hda [Gammaproteobacteria bacterium]